MIDKGERRGREVSPGLLRRFLISQGWHRSDIASDNPTRNQAIVDDAQHLISVRGTGRKQFEMFSLSAPGEDQVDIAVPTGSESPDFWRLMDSALRTLSELYDLSPSEIVERIKSVGFDVIKSRIPDELLHNESIPLRIAEQYITGMKGLLASTATSEITPGPFYRRVRAEATEYTDTCLFGHTFRGSFGFTIESPIQPNMEPVFPIIPESPPFGRRVIQRLAYGLHAIHLAVDQDDLAPLLNGSNTGFGANSYDQLADLLERTDAGSISFEFQFSPEWHMPDHSTRYRQSVEIGPKHIELARTAAKSLRTEHAEGNAEIFGRVTRLQSEANPSDLLDPTGDREVTILSNHPTFGRIKVKTLLAPADYLIAVEAHKDGRPLRVMGNLSERRMRWQLADAILITSR